MIHCDFETRSACDLLKHGIYRYATHPTTDVNCLGWAIDEDEPELWMRGDPIPRKLRKAIERGEMIAAWNAQFERLIWNNVFVRYGMPPLPINRFYCIAALSRARGYPGKLEKAAQFAELPLGKDMEGHYLMLKLCKPRKVNDDMSIVWWDDPDEHRRQGRYCLRDVEVERNMFRMFVPFTDEELNDYHISEEINDRGICVDLDLARAAVNGAAKEKLDSNDAIKALTGGAVTTCNEVKKILAWVDEEWKALPSLNKSDVLDALQEDRIPPHVADVLELRLANAKAAVAKYDAILNHQIDGVVYGGYLYRGAGQTGRFTSMGVQRHNLKRESRTDTIPILKKHGIKGLRMMGDPVNLLAEMVRPTFIAAPGRTLLIGDYAQVEARIAAWLAGEDKLLKVFADRHGDAYSDFGTRAFKKLVSKKGTPLERQVSKHCVLGLCFGGAEGALARSCKREGNIVLPGEQLTYLVQFYRKDFSRIVKLWYALRDAIMQAMYSRGTMVEVSYVAYLFDGEHLWCRLPSGRLMCYPYAVIGTDDYGNDVVEYRRGNRNPKSGVTEWPVVQLWYGVAIENLAQAIAADLLMNAMRKLRESDVRLHTHDELVVEVDEPMAERLLPVMLATMEDKPAWADGLPVHAEGGIRTRYQKI